MTTAPLPGPADVPALEARLRADSSMATRIRLAHAYREAGQANRSAALLEPVVRIDSTQAGAAIGLGRAYEDLGRFADARRVYEALLRRSPDNTTRRRLQERLRVVARLELREAVRAAIARERELSTQPPQPRTVGVFPFLFVASDTSLRPLGRAMAELLTTDLAQTNRLRVLERAQLQYLAEEIRLSQEGHTDPATAVRAGRVLSAAHIVQGRIDGAADALGVQAQVVATSDGEAARANPIREQGRLAQLFNMEKELALAILSALGIQLTAAERQRINERQTENVQALLAFGYGLEAEDAGRYQEAAAHFRRATELDPDFTLAETHATETQAWSEILSFTGRELDGIAVAIGDGNVTTWQRDQLGLDVIQTIVPEPQQRDATVEFLGTEGLGSNTRTIDIIIRRPTGTASGAGRTR